MLEMLQPLLECNLGIEYGKARQAALLLYGYVRANYQDGYLHGQVAGFVLTLPILEAAGPCQRLIVYFPDYCNTFHVKSEITFFFERNIQNTPARYPCGRILLPSNNKLSALCPKPDRGNVPKRGYPSYYGHGSVPSQQADPFPSVPL